MSKRNTKGQFKSKGFQGFHYLIIGGVATIVFAGVFGSIATARFEEWKTNLNMNATYQTHAPLTLTTSQLTALQNKNSALR